MTSFTRMLKGRLVQRCDRHRRSANRALCDRHEATWKLGLGSRGASWSSITGCSGQCGFSSAS
jgi:hypothetical protein